MTNVKMNASSLNYTALLRHRLVGSRNLTIFLRCKIEYVFHGGNAVIGDGISNQPHGFSHDAWRQYPITMFSVTGDRNIEFCPIGSLSF